MFAWFVKLFFNLTYVSVSLDDFFILILERYLLSNRGQKLVRFVLSLTEK